MKRLLRWPYVAWVVLTFGISLLVIAPLGMAAAAISKRNGKRWIHTMVRNWCAAWLWCIGMPLQVTGPRPLGKKQVIVVNHISYLDTLLIFPAIGHFFRVLAMGEVAGIPLFGPVYRQLAIIVDRSSPLSRANSFRRLHAALDREASVVVFPEGGLNETSAVLKPFYDGAFRLAMSVGVEVQPLILPDTVDRWHYSRWYSLWPGTNRAIFLEPVQVQDGDTVQTLKERVRLRMEEALVAARQ